MILKKADDKSADLKALEALLTRRGLTGEQSKRIEQHLRSLRSGIKGEAEAAYEIDFVFRNDNWVVIHDLRLEHKGQVAQIDHLLINRFMQLYVIESKRFAEGLGINEHGECVAFYGSKPVGVPSPFEQNAKHCLVLERLANDDALQLPRRLGIKIRPQLVPLVMVSKNARISRPKKLISGLMGDIIKADQLSSFIEKRDEDSSITQAARIVSAATVADLGRQLVALHKPAHFNWAAMFGLPETESSADTPSPGKQSLAQRVPPAASSVVSSTALSQADRSATARELTRQEDPADEVKPGSKLVCQGCGVATPYQVARFCWMNKRRFGGDVYCRECQSGK